MNTIEEKELIRRLDSLRKQIEVEGPIESEDTSIDNDELIDVFDYMENTLAKAA